MPSRLNLVGETYGQLVVLEFAGIKWGKTMWKCLCSCGTYKVICSRPLRSGETKSCGCLVSKLTIEKNFKHGCSTRTFRSKTYKIWCGVIARCTIPSATGYADYGARGISVCSEWRDYRNFLKDMGDCPAGHSIERRDSNKNYCPENCFWLPRQKQNHNKRNTLYLTLNGVKKRVMEWSKELKVPYMSLYWKAKEQQNAH